MTPRRGRPEARIVAGTAAFRAGDYTGARREFERALALCRARLGPEAPQTVRILSDLGAVHAAQNDHAASRAAHEAALAGRRKTLGDLHEDTGVSLHNLGAALSALGENHAAIAAQTEAIAIWRATLGPTHPIIARALDALATAHAQAGAHEAAIAHWHQALAIPGAPASPTLLKLGLSQRRLADLPAAAASFTAALRADDTNAAARHHLAAVLTRLGRAEEARPHLAAALQHQRVFIQDGPPEAPRVLILASTTQGNIPLDHLLPEACFTRIWWFIDHAPDPRAEPLPGYDIVFNAIGDPDTAQNAQAALAAFTATCAKPVLNQPAHVARTRRDRLPALLHGIDGLVVPRICRIEGAHTRPELMRATQDAGIAPPLLLRPAGAHGGAGVLRIEDWHGVNLPDAEAWYATAFHDCRGTDGHTRKYRVIFIDRTPYPYHLAISPDWLVHYFSAGMEAHAWKLAEEAAFLADPAAALGARAMDALHEAARRLDLDYCGIDFGLAAGEIVVFEANPTMLVHPEPATGPLAFKNPAVARIFTAFERKVRQEVLV